MPNVEAGRLFLESEPHLLARIQDYVVRAALEQGRTDSVVDELLSERRAEVAREGCGP